MDINNILLAPLVDDGETIGMLELATSTPGKLNPISANRVENVLPMFTAAVKRVKEEMSPESTALIQGRMHVHSPNGVQWRFFEAGVNLLNKRRHDDTEAMEKLSSRMFIRCSAFRCTQLLDRAQYSYTEGQSNRI
jgi:hypothetical protein